MHEAPLAPPSRYERGQGTYRASPPALADGFPAGPAPTPPERPTKAAPQLPARLNNMVSSVATPERRAQANKTYDRVQENYGRVVTKERKDMAWRGVQTVGEGVVGLVGKIKGSDKK
jgi:hypothetical protein